MEVKKRCKWVERNREKGKKDESELKEGNNKGRREQEKKILREEK